ncbi:hypothetical protein KKJ06_17950 [Xenorhabdus bovienii]|uniref:Flagellar biosynthesis sigma factor n=2 Tax=Xenorhabdus bovienii TaxID=40576 RepID=A0A077PQ21_XENBV|nr:hypothetical protein [Xenorhabdus bovienii]MDE9455434.1 hypothetical protein [Xenorhabdus bovienii]MDE9557247.1 hypothetical protein [Xenorhabdus bovienii]CDH21934.1 hypothetical protein XBKQ1_840006 [Xenorhabdus bovienii str. kraussei Quebec]CDH34778.1 hypothetical protein XBI1_540003 [Xenorhabdus bovienii str. Intermedium]
MNLLQRMRQQRGRLILALLIILSLIAAYLYHAFNSREPAEIALVIGEPYEAMRQRSSAKISPPYDNSIGFRIPKTDARLRFTDPKYGFITPPARFFTVSYNKGIIENVRMSPQIEPLLYDDAIKIVLDLQDQWRKAGWTLTLARESPALANTPELRAKLRSLIGSEVTYWQAGEQYQIMLIMARFKDDRHPDEERYLITLAIAEPWVKNYSD